MLFQSSRVWQHRHIHSHTPLRQSYSGGSSRASCRSLPPHLLPHSGHLATASLDMPPHRGSRGRRRTGQEDEDDELRLSTTSSSLSSQLHEQDSAYHSLSQRPIRSSLQSIHHPRLSSQPYLPRTTRERYALNRQDLSRNSLDYDVTSSRAPSCDIPRHSYAHHNQSYLQPAYSRKHSIDGATPVIRNSDAPLYTRKHSYDGIVPVVRGNERSHYAKADMDGLNRRRELTRERNIATHLEEEPLEVCLIFFLQFYHLFLCIAPSFNSKFREY